ncbi:MAG: DMT family transporter [Gammaproteobacteria bacterium]
MSTVAPDPPLGGWFAEGSRVFAYALIVAASVLWGSTFALAKIVADSGAHPVAITFWQSLGGALLLWGLCRVRGVRVPVDNAHLKFYAVLGLIGSALPGCIFYVVASRVPAGVLSISVATVPMMTYAATLALRLDTLTARRSLGLAVGLSAVALIVLPDASLPEPGMGIWVLLAVGASASYAVENIYVALRGLGTDAGALVCGMSLAGALWLAPLLISTDASMSFAPWGKAQWSLVLLTVASALAYSMYLTAIRAAGPVFASQTGYLVTLTGVGWGIVILAESHSAWVWTSLALMLGGVALVTPRSR